MKRILFASAFVMAIAGAFAFQANFRNPNANANHLQNTATAFYTVTTACDHSKTCSDQEGSACAAGVTNYFTTSGCGTASNFKYLP